jgi:hypothetical protein
MQQCQAHPKGDTAREHNQQRHRLRACSKCKPEAVDIPGSPNTQRRCSWQDDPPSVNALVPQCDTQTEQHPKKIPGEHTTLNVLAGSVQHNHNMCSRAKKAPTLRPPPTQEAQLPLQPPCSTAFRCVPPCSAYKAMLRMDVQSAPMCHASLLHDGVSLCASLQSVQSDAAQHTCIPGAPHT